MGQEYSHSNEVKEGGGEGARGEEERNGGTVVGRIGRTEEDVPIFVVNRPPVNWEPVRRLKPSKYIDYKGLIMNERTPALFPKSSGFPVFIGAMYAHSVSGVSIPSPRRVYFEASNPEKPVMRVPESQDDEDKVVTSYSWDRTNFVYQELSGPHAPQRIFQIFTPANLGTYGIVADVLEEPKWVPIFAALPKGKKAAVFFTDFQIKLGQDKDHITNTKETLGMYVDKVDEVDGWKVNITANTSLWDKFSIAGFSPPSPPKEHCYSASS